jgi:hypothetical protein
MLEEENQMGLFEIAGATPVREAREAMPALSPSAKPAPAPAAKPAPRAHPKPAPTAKPAGKKLGPPAAASQPAERKISGLVPEGDVRLTANIRQDLHLKLKIASAHRRTTIGEIIEELIEMHL